MELQQPSCDHEAEEYESQQYGGRLEVAESLMTSMTHTDPIWGPPTFLVKKTTDVFITYATVAVLPMTLSSL